MRPIHPGEILREEINQADPEGRLRCQVRERWERSLDERPRFRPPVSRTASTDAGLATVCTGASFPDAPAYARSTDRAKPSATVAQKPVKRCFQAPIVPRAA